VPQAVPSRETNSSSLKTTFPKLDCRWRGGCSLRKQQLDIAHPPSLSINLAGDDKLKTTTKGRLHVEIARVFILMLLVVPALAQTRSANTFSNEALNEMVPEVSVENNEAEVIALPDAPVSQAPKVRVRVVDKKFIAVMAALGGAETLRFTTHKLVLDNEFSAGAPWVSSLPANQHLVAKYAAIYAAEVLVAYELKKPHSWLLGDKVIRKFWWAYPAAMIPIHIKNGVGSIRTQPPSCPPEECAMQ
jgi:hypothetical protein